MKTVGTKNNVATVAKSNPPITARPSGAFCSPPSPRPKAIGIIPMALGLGEGGDQNAPLGRAVIGGLLFATVSTLFFVPVVFSIIHRHDGPKPEPESHLRGTDVPA